MTIAEQFADFSVTLEYEQLPPQVIGETKVFFLDWLGAAFRGGGEEPTRIALEVLKDWGGGDESTVIADMSRNSCIAAALANGISSHAVEIDDVHREGMYHPGGPVFSAILPLAEKLEVTGKRFIEAAVVGYEIGIRSAVAAGKSHYRYWHTTGTCGTFGAAAGVAKLLSLDRKQTAWALGNAGTQASGLWEFLGENAMSKQFHPGKAAMNGILAATFARKGFTGATSIYEGEKGFFQATSENSNPVGAVEKIGSGVYKITETSIKKHASCGHTHSALDAVIDLVTSHSLGAEDISRIDVGLNSSAFDLLAKVKPTTPSLARFSIPFCVATAVIFNRVGLEAFAEERLRDREVLRIADSVFLHEDEELTVCFPDKMSAMVTIETKAGDILVAHVHDPKGTPENPLTFEEITDKFRQVTADHLRGTSETILQRVMALDECTSMNDFFDNLK